MGKQKRFWKLSALLLASVLVLSGCNWFANEFGKMKDAFEGREVEIRTFDEEAQVIDSIKGKSVSIAADGKFDLTNSNGETVEKSSVINFMVGGHSFVHVGSSLIMAEKGLEDVLATYSQTVDIDSIERSVPIVNRMVNEVTNLTTGKDKVILIRSQSGKPLATYVGQDVSYFATDVDKSTGLIIDGKYLFIYRSDYSIYDAALLK